MADRANANEGADPSSDIKQQNLGGTTTGDLTQGTGQSRAGSGEGPDTDENGHAKDESEKNGDATKTQDLAKAGRKDMDPNAGEE
jgi:hypothetical protein